MLPPPHNIPLKLCEIVVSRDGTLDHAAMAASIGTTPAVTESQAGVLVQECKDKVRRGAAGP